MSDRIEPVDVHLARAKADLKRAAITIERLRAEVERLKDQIAEDVIFKALRERIAELEGGPYTHEAVDAFWRVWNEIGRPHIHGVYESTWAAFRAALGVERSAR